MLANHWGRLSTAPKGESMRRKFTLSLAATTLGLCVMSSAASAFISAEAQIGRGSYTLKADSDSYKYSGTDIMLSASIDPIPLVPVGFGLSLSLPNYKSEESDSKETFTGALVGLEVLGWVPGPLPVRPYARLGYTILGGFTANTNDVPKVEAETTVRGVYAGVGIGYSVIPLLEITAEYKYTPGADLTITKVTIDGTDVTSALTSADKKSTFSGGTILVGARLGI